MVCEEIQRHMLMVPQGRRQENTLAAQDHSNLRQRHTQNSYWISDEDIVELDLTKTNQNRSREFCLYIVLKGGLFLAISKT